MATFEQLQARLASALALNTPGSTVPHVLVALPSFSVGESLLSHYGSRIPALEHRYLVVHAMLQRISSCDLVFIGSQDPGDDVRDYYLSLVPLAQQDDVRKRFHTVVVNDRTYRSVAEKLLDQPTAMAEVRRLIAGRPAFIEPWNVTEHEVDVAVALQLPVNGASPDVWPLAYKSAGRRLFREAGVPLPYGHEDVRTVDDVVSAVADIRRARPQCRAVVVKHDDSGAGDGNVVVPLDGDGDEVRERIEALPEWYLTDLRDGGIVEERITGEQFSSPSAQIDLQPDGGVRLLATHEQELGGDDGQVYIGCRFPAEPTYAVQLGRHAVAVGEQLARRGALGRISVDFAAARDAEGAWRGYALEVNLRKGGTTHPYAALRNYVRGAYDGNTGQWRTEDGEPRAYRATDNLVSESWVGLAPATVIKALGGRGLHFDHRARTGVVLHMLSCLAIDGRFGLTAIGRDPHHATELFDAARTAVEASV